MNVQIENSWKHQLQNEFEKPYFHELTHFIKTEIEAGKLIYPKGPQIFNAFALTPFDTIKVVILGQDPYHNPGQAHGLCFSVPEHVALPPSLLNIFKELKASTGTDRHLKGNLSGWAQQGILLLNTSLTVRKNEPMSHSKIGWEKFTDAVIKLISDKTEGVVFLLWGAFARSKKLLIDPSRHFILTAAHPSPLSAHNGFFGCSHFSKTNELLISQQKDPIDWSL